MVRKWPFEIAQWFKDGFALYRGMRSSGDLSASDMRQLLADDIQTRLEAGDSLGRAIWIDFIDKYDRDLSKTQTDARALEEASGYLQPDLFPQEVLDNLGLPPFVDLGFNKKVMTPDLDWDGFERAIKEATRKEESWEKSLGEQKQALKRAQALVPRDNSKTLRQVISDPEEYGYGTGAQAVQ